MQGQFQNQLVLRIPILTLALRFDKDSAEILWVDIMLFFLLLIGMDYIIPQISSSRKKHDDYLFIHYLHQIN